MSYQASNVPTHITFKKFLCPERHETQVSDILENLTAVPRSIPSKYLYDKMGSILFDAITTLPEYYLTNLEIELIEAFAQRNKSSLHHCDIVDIGSGSDKKVAMLLKESRHVDSITYTPIDVSTSALETTAVQMVKKYPDIHVNCIAADFLTQLQVLGQSSTRRIFCFFGSTIGNLSHSQRHAILRTIGELMNTEDLLLLGVDLIKEIPVMERAYNDRLQVTARFNTNILNVVNSLIQTNFDQKSFIHKAFYNNSNQRIEMHLEASHTMSITSPFLSCPLRLLRGESIHTENSCKFTIPQISSEAQSAGYHIHAAHTDKRCYYVLMELSRHDSF